MTLLENPNEEYTTRGSAVDRHLIISRRQEKASVNYEKKSPTIARKKEDNAVINHGRRVQKWEIL